MSFVENKLAVRKKVLYLIAEINYCSEMLMGCQNDVRLNGRREAAILLLNMEGYEWDHVMRNAYIDTGLGGKDYFPS